MLESLAAGSDVSNGTWAFTVFGQLLVETQIAKPLNVRTAGPHPLGCLSISKGIGVAIFGSQIVATGEIQPIIKTLASRCTLHLDHML